MRRTSGSLSRLAEMVKSASLTRSSSNVRSQSSRRSATSVLVLAPERGEQGTFPRSAPACGRRPPRWRRRLAAARPRGLRTAASARSSGVATERLSHARSPAAPSMQSSSTSAAVLRSRAHLRQELDGCALNGGIRVRARDLGDPSERFFRVVLGQAGNGHQARRGVRRGGRREQQRAATRVVGVMPRPVSAARRTSRSSCSSRAPPARRAPALRQAGDGVDSGQREPDLPDPAGAPTASSVTLGSPVFPSD